jgi:hypothetical protein
MTAILDDTRDDQLLDSLHDRLLIDFARAGAELAEARRRQQAKDTPAHRTAVLDCRARVDAVLDMHLELEDGRRQQALSLRR